MCPQQAATRFLVLSVLVVSAQAQEQEPCHECSAADTNPSSKLGNDVHGENMIQVNDAPMRNGESYRIFLFQSGIDGNTDFGPSEVRHLHLKSVSETHAELHWQSPIHRARDIVRYSVSVKMNELTGCQDLGISTPPTVEILQNVTNTSVSIFGLHPYAVYTANVIALTRSMPGPPQAVTIKTRASYIPTSVVNNLRFDKEQNRVEWDEPVDCTTISGRIPGVRLFFDGVSPNVQNWTSRQPVSTYYNHYPLDKMEMVPGELYRVRVHVIRGYTLPENRTLYEELTFRTQPAAPPAVRLLDFYNLDDVENSISLRWLPPLPPHGEIESYHVSIGKINEVLKNQTIVDSEKVPMCRQWENYLCFENVILPSNITTDQNVEVYAKNRHVRSLGAPASIVLYPNLMRNKVAPTEPLNLTAIMKPSGVLRLEWAHPLTSYKKIVLFWIRVDAIGTKSNECQSPQYSISTVLPVDQEDRKYGFEMTVPGSKTYRVSVAALDRKNSNSPDAQVEATIPKNELGSSPPPA